MKEEINFGEKTKPVGASSLNFDELERVLKERSTEICEASLYPESKENVFLVAGYVAKKLKKRIECKSCVDQL